MMLKSVNNASDGVNGAIKILLPTASNSCHMMFFDIDIYNYLSNTSTKILCGGYNYIDSHWYETFAFCSNKGMVKRIRFAKDTATGNACIIIGSIDQTWRYPNVSINRVLSGYTYTMDLIGDYSISWITTEDGLEFLGAYEPAINANLDADTLDGLHYNDYCRLVSDGTFWGLVGRESAGEYIRTTTSGFIPYTSGNIYNGHGYIGASSWCFAEMHSTKINSYDYKCAGIAGQITQVASTAPGTVNILWAY